MKDIQLRDAKATLSAVIADARNGVPSIITKHGRPEAVIISFEEWTRLSAMPSFGFLLAMAPIEPGDIPDRSPEAWRDVDL